MDSIVDGSDAPRTHVVAVPFPGRGHINPMLSLCRLLASRGVSLVTVVVTEEWLGLLNSGGDTSFLPPIIRFRTIPNVIPSEKVRGADYTGFIDAVYSKMEAPFERLMEEIKPPANLIVADLFLSWVAEVGQRRAVPVSALWTQSAAEVLAKLEMGGVVEIIQPEGNENECSENAARYLLKPLVDPNDHSAADRMVRLGIRSVLWVKDRAHSLLLTSFQDLEPDAIKTLSLNLPCQVYPLGPSIPYMALEQDQHNEAIIATRNVDHPHLQWLSSQPRSSVLYISLGSFSPISSTKMEEIATALHATGIRFLWVAREESSNMQEKSGGMGLAVPWSDQLRVLCHPSVGGFLTHCGWNSIQEAVYTGVPMLALPLVWDQLHNCKMVVEDWKVGLRLMEEERGADDGCKEEISRNMIQLMDLDGDESKELRRRMGELKEFCRRAIQDGGSTSSSFDAFIKSICTNEGRVLS